MFIAGTVLFDAVMVGSAIEFDDEFGGGTGEVGEKAVDGMLATELEALELMVSKQSPERGLGGCLGLAKFAGAGGLRGWHEGIVTLRRFSPP